MADAYPLYKGESLEAEVKEHAVRLKGVEKDIGMLKEDTADICADVDKLKEFATVVKSYIAVNTTLTGQLAWFVKIAAGAIITGAIALIIKAFGG